MNPTDVPVGQPGVGQPGPWRPATYSDAGRPGGRPPKLPMRRWVRVLLAVLMVPVTLLAVLIGVVLISDDVLGDKHVDLPPVAYPGAAVAPGTLLASLRERPVPGWSFDLQMVHPDAGSAFIDYIGATEERAFFAVTTYSRSKDPLVQHSWLLGLDATTGRQLFDPVPIAGTDEKCYRNGPDRVFCLNRAAGRGSAADRYDAYVIDAVTGRIISHGPSELAPRFRGHGGWEVDQIGDYAVATRDDKDIRGIGDDGKPSWFAAGELWFHKGVGGFAQVKADSAHYTVLSLADGSVAAFGEGFADLYDDGFVVSERHKNTQTLRFYDRGGVQVGDYRAPKGARAYLGADDQLPWLTFNSYDDDETQLIFDLHGVPMVAVRTGKAAGRLSRLIGANAYAEPTRDSDTPTGVWSKYSLQSGERVSQCAGLPLSYFIGSDGAVVLGRVQGEDGRSGPAVAVDTNTCAKLWQIEAPRVWCTPVYLASVS